MPGAHATLSPSAAKRWVTCTPSARLNQKLIERFGESSSPYAAEGTQAHSLSELKLLKDIGEINDFNYKAQREKLGKITAEMEKFTDYYVDAVLERYYTAKRICPDARLFVEQRLDMSRWIPQCFGTSDAVIVSDSGLEVCDLKYGKGVPVDAVGNYQARIYALGAIDMFSDLYDFKDVRETIIQPRLDSITEEILSKQELLDWGESIRPKAEMAWKGEGEFIAGEHCRFCNARAICKARVVEAMGIFNYGFDSPDVLPDSSIPEILKVADAAESWLKDVRQYALNQALQGTEWQGYKLVRGKRPGRVWKNEDDVLDQLCRAGYSEEQYMQPAKMKSVSEMEKTIGKQAFAALLGGMVFQGEGNLSLVPESDKREAYSPLELAFSDLVAEQPKAQAEEN